IVYIGVGRHPIVGMLCGYAGANVGYAANPIISGTGDAVPHILAIAVVSVGRELIAQGIMVGNMIPIRP
ncbi:MAG: AbgT family transporter, partial [Alistipes sp.]|nr:AbgT family transporter [Alistipes sp.]